ncbi:centrosomal AT-AC splicing factor-like isoform X2 [Sycon ciliatum]|uniref:centrosomal AT-AC splicing factor-like isoform X2 n=1 Tax=Sycon ciliatum TaxID=27933 RepID=UPI0031F67E4A
MAEDLDDERCELCRFHPAEGLRKHAFTARHKKSVRDRFLPFLKKLDTARKDLKKPHVVDGEIASDAFWCHPCASRVEKHITDGESSIVNGGTLAHMGSDDHAKNSKTFCQRHGVFVVEKAALSKLILENSLLVSYLELVREATEKLQHDDVRSKEAQYITSQEKIWQDASKMQPTAALCNPMAAEYTMAQPAYRTVTNSFGILQNPTGWHDGQRVWGGGIVKYPPGSDQLLQWSVDRRQPTVTHGVASSCRSMPPPIQQPEAGGDGEIGVASGMTRIAKPVVKGLKGNVHTGATPPWLLPDNLDSSSAAGDAAQATAIGPSLEDFQQHAYRQQFASSNPKRVGADHVNAMIRQGMPSAAAGGIASGSEANDPLWLPNFGRVYNHGARSDTKREFYKELQHRQQRKGSRKRRHRD